MNVCKVSEKTEYLEKPDDNDDHHDDVDDPPDLVIHWNVGIDEP